MQQIAITVQPEKSESKKQARANALQKIANRGTDLIIALGKMAETSKTDEQLLKMLNNPFVKRAL